LLQGDLSALSRHIRAAVSSAGSTDRELLARFANARDESAFAVLVGRYGRLVQNVCSNVLGDEHDAEEAAQATFLVLARRASSLHGLEVLAGWLHGVAYRTALRARRDANRRRARETRERPVRAVSPPEPSAEASHRELQAILDQELQRLPERLRTPFALCCLEGYGHGEAALRLGWKTETVSNRLHQARKLLRRRLARRGVNSSAVLGALTVADGRVRAGLPSARASETAAAARRYLDGAAPGPAAKLAEAMLREAVRARARAAMIAAAVAGVLVIGVGMRLRRAEARTAGPEPVAINLPVLAVAVPPRMDAFGDALPADAIARLGTVRFGHDWYTDSAVWSPDGKVIASLGGRTAARPVSLWDAASGRELHQFAAKDAVPAAAFSPDSKTLATAEGKRGIVLWDVGSGTELDRFTDQGDGAAVAFSPDGQKLAAAGRDGVIQIREVRSGRLVVELKARGEPLLRRVGFALDGKVLASTGDDGAVILWDLATGTERWRRHPHGGRAFGLAFAPDGQTFATTGADGVVRVWDTHSGDSLGSFPGRPYGLLIAYSPDGQTLAAPGPDDFVCVWDPSTGKEKRRWHTGEKWIQSVSYSPDGRTLATTGFMGSRVRLWDAETGEELHASVGHNASVYSLSFGPDGKTVWSAGADRTLIRWDVASGEGQPLARLQPHGSFCTADFTGDGRIVATGRTDGIICLWDVNGDLLGTLTGHTDAVHKIAFSRDGKLLASSGSDRTVRLWDVTARRELRQTQMTDGTRRSLAFSPDGRKLALALGQEPVSPPAEPVVLDTLTGKGILRLECPSSSPGAPEASEEFVTFSPNGKMLATVGKYQATVIRLWDATTGKLIGRCGGPTDCRLWFCLAFSPDCRLLATGPGDHDDSVHLWELATFQEVARLRGHHGGVTALAFSPDGHSLASGSGDATVLVWDLTGNTASDQRRLGRLSPSRLEAYWKDLGGDDVPAAYRAVRDLAADPVRSVPYLARRLRSSELAYAAKMADLPVNATASPHWLRQLRAVMAMEYSATSEARQRLRNLTTTEAGTPLAEEARAALDRLE
jgi:RNA polymerase sigma factor (sigma-70 family)